MTTARGGGFPVAWRALLTAVACAGACVAGLPHITPPAAPPERHVEAAPDAGARPPACALGEQGPDGATALEHAVRAAVEGARFEEVIDLGATDDPACPGDPHCTTTPIAHTPSVDVAVIAFAPGCPPAFANAMLSRDAPGVRLNRFDPATLALRAVRLRRWDQARWDDADAGAVGHGEASLVVPPPPDEAAAGFTVPYPASSFKLLVAVKLLELADRGILRLDETFAHGRRTRAIGEWLDDMITWSDDESTQALIRKLHALGEAERIDALFARLGLSTLQIHGTSATTGRSWQPGQIHMTAWDTARLLWLLDADAPAPSWQAPGGAPVDAGFLRADKKKLLLGLLGDQRFHDALSTTALCGVAQVRAGIPSLVPGRWIADDGHLRTGEGDPPGADVRPCNAAAEVTFAHKTGLTLNFGSDVGIVRGIEGRARRHYVIAFFSNLGHRYTDPDKASGPNPCHHLGICYTQRIAGMAKAIDDTLAAAVEAR